MRESAFVADIESGGSWPGSPTASSPRTAASATSRSRPAEGRRSTPGLTRSERREARSRQGASGRPLLRAAHGARRDLSAPHSRSASRPATTTAAPIEWEVDLSSCLELKHPERGSRPALASSAGTNDSGSSRRFGPHRPSMNPERAGTHRPALSKCRASRGVLRRSFAAIGGVRRPHLASRRDRIGPNSGNSAISSKFAQRSRTGVTFRPLARGVPPPRIAGLPYVPSP